MVEASVLLTVTLWLERPDDVVISTSTGIRNSFVTASRNLATPCGVARD